MSTKHWWNASKMVHLKASEFFMCSIIHFISDRPILKWHHIWLENLAVSFVCNACTNTYVSLCFETRLFPNLRQEPMTVTYFICLSWRVDENSMIKSILYLCKFCFRVSSHCVWSFMLSSLLVRSFILRRLLHDLTISSQNRRKFWHWNDINIEEQMYGTLYPVSLDTSSFYK